MTRSRAVLITSLSIVLSGTALALSALWLDPARAAVGPMPAEGLTLPADTKFVMGFDMKRFLASPFYARYASKDKPKHLEAIAKLEEQTGVNIERDIDSVIVAGRGRTEPGDQGLVLVSGRFDRYKLARAIEAEKKVTWKKVEGETVYVMNETSAKGRGGLTFLDENTLAIGNLAALEQMLANRSNRSATLESNTALVELVRQVRPGAAFWMVGDKSALAQMPKNMPGPGNDQMGFNLPALQSVIVTADLDPAVSLQFTGATTDEATAKQLADVVRGFLALATLQAGQRPELKELQTAVSVATEANKVHVNAKLPYELLDSLQQAGKGPRKAAELTIAQ